MAKYFKMILPIFCLLLANRLLSQNLEELGLKKGLKISGSMNLNTVAYLANGLENRREPFNWFASGNLNIRLFGYNAPFSFSYSNTQRNFAQPFNQLKFSPRFKWIQLHGGYTSLNFSPYTLSGHIFLGVGLELSPGKWRVSAMYGRLLKAIPFNPLDSIPTPNASFERRGLGIKLGREGSQTSWDVNIFSAKDDPNSLAFIPPNSVLSPEQNLALGFHIRQRIGAHFFTEVTYAISALNSDLRANNDSLSLAPEQNNFLTALLPQNSTSRFFDAVNANFGYQGKFYTLSVQYERIAPEYRTLGGYFFNNDLRNITISPQIQLFKKKLTLATNIGIGRNNLDESRGSTTRRLVSSVNINYSPQAAWNFSSNYSNFSTFVNRRPLNDPFFRDNLDTLNFYQVNQTLNLSINHQFGKHKYRQNVLINASYQRANSETDSQIDDDNLSNFYSLNGSYSLHNQSRDQAWTLSINYYLNESMGINSVFFGPNLSIRQSLLNKRLKANLSTAYNQNKSQGQTSSGDIWNTRLNLNYSPPNTGKGSQGHRLSLNISYLKRFSSSNMPNGFSEFTTTMGYTYSF